MANTLWDKIESKFTELKAQLTASASPAADHSKTISDFRSQLDGFKTELDAKDGQLSTLTASNTKLTADLQVAQAAVTEFDAKVEAAASKKALEITASLGTNPLKTPASTATNDAKTKTRAEFSAMTPANQTAFCKAGGKLTD